jgi:hypothetical protein
MIMEMSMDTPVLHPSPVPTSVPIYVLIYVIPSRGYVSWSVITVELEL